MQLAFPYYKYFFRKNVPDRTQSGECCDGVNIPIVFSNSYYFCQYIILRNAYCRHFSTIFAEF